MTSVFHIDSLFTRPWREVDTCWIDFETTGTQIGIDQAVQVGFSRFSGGQHVDTISVLIRPTIPIPKEATAIHGITEEMVAKSPLIDEVLQLPLLCDLLVNAQPAAYNAAFDRNFCSAKAVNMDWPWLDALSLVRVVDKFAKGKGRHRLSEACKRHGVELSQAHSAGADARAAGELFYKLAPTVEVPGRGSIANWTLGQLLCWQGIEEKREWYRFHEWRAKQPPLLANQPTGH